MTEFTTNQKGDITEVECILTFIRAGFKVSIPYGEDTKYDLILDINNKLYRIQCKTSRALTNPNDGFKFKCISMIKYGPGNFKSTCYTKEDIDYFATVFNGQCYLIPVEECKTEKTLRFRYPSNNQKKFVSLADDYKFEEVIKHLL